MGSVEQVALDLLTGIMSNPNYNFQNIKKAVDDAIAHAEALVKALEAKGIAGVHAAAVSVDVLAKKVEVGAAVVEGVASKVATATEPAPSVTVDPLTL